MTIFTDDEVIFNEVQNTSEIDLVKVFGRKDENDEESDENENAHKDGQADEEDAKTLMITFPSMLQLDEVKSTRKRKRKWKEEAYLDESSESEEVVLERKSAKYYIENVETLIILARHPKYHAESVGINTRNQYAFLNIEPHIQIKTENEVTENSVMGGNILSDY